jgi:hypothetical protein
MEVNGSPYLPTNNFFYLIALSLPKKSMTMNLKIKSKLFKDVGIINIS